MSPEAQAVLADLHGPLTYEQIREKYGWSRGRIYALALKHGARKTERRIHERAADRMRRQQETLKELIDKTAKADVLDYLDSLPSGCANMVLTSIPYNLGKSYGSSPCADSLAYVYYVGWMMQVISDCARILKPGAVMFLEAGSTRDETGSLIPLDVVLFDAMKKSGLEFQSRIAWTVPHGLTPKRRLSERYETALVFSKGPIATFNPTPGRTPQKQPGKRAFKGPNKGKLSGHPLGAFPSNVWPIPNIGANHPEKTGHPAQFPVELARRAIQIYTNVGDLVIDPFSGSGTTHVAARETGRGFSGADLFYEDLREVRLAKAGLADICPLPGVSDASVAVWQAEAVPIRSIPAHDRSVIQSS